VFLKSRVRANLKHGSVRGINNQQRRLKRCLLDKTDSGTE